MRLESRWPNATISACGRAWQARREPILGIMPMIRKHRICGFVLGVLLVTSVPSPITAQQKRVATTVTMGGPEAVDEQTHDGLSIPKDREATGVIAAAKEYVLKKDWDTVARSLQYLLEKPEDSFFEVKRRRPDGKEYS